MATPHRLQAIAIEYGEDLDTLIPRLLNKHKTVTAVAHELDLSVKTVWTWVQDNEYEKEVRWVKKAS